MSDVEVVASAEAPRAVLFDFGGVLTASVFASFERFSREACGGDPNAVVHALSHDEAAEAALVDHECGRVEDEVFEEALAGALAAQGHTVEAAGLIARMQEDLHPDHAMTALVRRLKEQGVAVALVSNSLGRDCYTGHGLDELFEVQAISGREGVRKPSRRLYEVACERLGVRPAEAIMIDDLAMNIRAAQALGMGGIVHSDAMRTIPALAGLLGLDPETLGAEPATTGT